MKILHLLNYPGSGGSEGYILSLAEKLHKKRCTFYFAHSLPGPMLEKLKELDIDIFNIPMNSPYDLRAAKKLASLCSDYSIDIIHTHFMRENYISIFSRLYGCRAALVNTNHIIGSKNILQKITDNLLTVFNDKIIAVSYAARQKLISDSIRPCKIEVIHNGVDIDKWSSGQSTGSSTERDSRQVAEEDVRQTTAGADICAAAETGRRAAEGDNEENTYTSNASEAVSAIRQELGISRGDFVAVCVARFTEEKGQMFLIDSIRQLKSNTEGKIPGRLRLILTGDGETLDKCRKFAASALDDGDVIFTGYRTDIKNILYGCDLYISPSKNESLSLSIIEALACGLPVIASNAGGTSEIINKENMCGTLVEYGDTEGMVGAILQMLCDREQYDRFRRNAPNIAKEKFSLDKCANETYNLYKGVVNK